MHLWPAIMNYFREWLVLEPAIKNTEGVRSLSCHTQSSLTLSPTNKWPSWSFQQGIEENLGENCGFHAKRLVKQVGWCIMGLQNCTQDTHRPISVPNSLWTNYITRLLCEHGHLNAFHISYILWRIKLLLKWNVWKTELIVRYLRRVPTSVTIWSCRKLSQVSHNYLVLLCLQHVLKVLFYWMYL